MPKWRIDDGRRTRIRNIIEKGKSRELLKEIDISGKMRGEVPNSMKFCKEGLKSNRWCDLLEKK